MPGLQAVVVPSAGVAVDVLADDFVDVLRAPDVLAGGLAGAVAGLDLALAGVVVPLGGVEVAAVGEGPCRRGG